MSNLNQLLMESVQTSNLKEVSKLVKKGADINYIDPWSNCAMFTAAWEGNIEALELYHNLGAKLDLESNNPMCNAAYNGKIESVKWFIEKGANANFSFADTGENALHYTICKTSEMAERTEIVKLLINAGIDVNKKTMHGVSTLCFMRDAFCKAETPLHRAAAYGNLEIVKILIAAGSDITAKDANGDTPISWGSWFLRDSDILKLLVYDGVAGIW
ncbi:MAG: ankyrin repeat domain-containing protein [Bacteroidota bacterium]